MDDYWELVNGLDPIDPNDANENPDGDSLLNIDEYNQGRLPFIDDDGVDLYVDGENGNDNLYNGLSSFPRHPTISHGPKRTVMSAVDAASSEMSILLLPHSAPYIEARLNFSGKNITIRPAGAITLTAAP